MFLAITAHIIIQNNTIRILTLGTMQGKHDIFGMLSVEFNFVAIIGMIYVYIKCGGEVRTQQIRSRLRSAILGAGHVLHVLHNRPTQCQSTS